jgi:NADH:ubiquinone oxidoreductase subunit C
MAQDTKEIFEEKLKRKLGKSYTLKWDTDNKGVVFGWCTLANAMDIKDVADAVAELKGRVMTISPYIPSGDNKPGHVEISYHFYFDGINFTAHIILPEGMKKVKSITPVLKSADWHEREMQELYNLQLIGHPNPKRLFLEENIPWTDRTMIPLSEALNGASSNTLWEKIMEAKSGEAKSDE